MPPVGPNQRGWPVATSYRRAAGRGDDPIVDDQGRTHEAPAGVLDFFVGRRVARPHNRSRRGVERVQDSGRPEL